MTQPQIDEARAALAELTTDEQELDTLATQRAEEISNLKASGSKDFAALAALEGQRAALQTMLTEQRGYVAAARDHLAELERGAARAGKLALIGEKAAQIRAAQQDRQAYMVALRDALPELLSPILDATVRWRAARNEWVDIASEAGTVMTASQTSVRGQAAEDQARALYAELEALGVDTAPLRWNPPGNVYTVLDSSTLERESFPPASGVFAGELDWVVYDLMAHASTAQQRAAGHATHTGQASGPAVVAPEALASTAYAPPEAPHPGPVNSFSILPSEQ